MDAASPKEPTGFSIAIEDHVADRWIRTAGGARSLAAVERIFQLAGHETRLRHCRLDCPRVIP